MSTPQKVVVVTGASQGFGAETVKAFRALGYRVVATSRSIKPSGHPCECRRSGHHGGAQYATREPV